MRGLIAAALLLIAGIAAAAEVPRGRRAPRPAATHVIVRATEIVAGGATLKVAPGVPVHSGGGGVTLLDDVQISGRVPAPALGLVLAHDVQLLDARGQPVGQGRAGAPVRTSGRAGDRVTIEPADPLAPAARFVVDAGALSAERHELVLPAPEYALLVVKAPTPLAATSGGPPRARLPAGLRVEPIAPADERGFMHVRTYGGIAVEGWVAKDRLAATDGSEVPAAPARGLTPNHEALVDAPIYADPRATRPIGLLRGGALVTAGVEVEGPRVKVMTHGDVVGEVWVAQAALRRLEASVWVEGR